MSRPPVMLVGAGLLFWGWQTGFLLPALLMAVVLEGAGGIRARWELSEEDFNRIWTFCTLLLLASLVFSFTNNQGPAEFRSLIENPTFRNQRNAGVSTGRTAASVVRWLPMLFFLFYAAQRFSTRQGVPLATLSLILGRRWRKARKLGLPLPASPNIDLGYGFLGLSVIAASVHSAEGLSYFWGVCFLTAWALASHRSSRSNVVIWAAALGAAVGIAYFGQRGVSELQRYVENLNPQWFARWQQRGRFEARESRTAIGRIGKVQGSATILLRLQTAPGDSPPELLREASYGTFTYPGSWISDLNNNTGTNVSTFAFVPETNNVWLLLRDKTNTASVRIACYLPGGVGLLPLPRGAARLENLPAYIVQKNNFGAVLAQGPGLVMFDALYGPGATIDSPPVPAQDLQIHSRETKVLSQIAAELQLAGKPREEILREVRRFFAQNFNYSTWQAPGPRRPGPTPLGRFLLETRSGHCEYFATATALLLRAAGIPARYAVGYYVHESPSAGKWVVRQRDAHAWVLVWNEESGLWEDFDTTPGSWVARERQRGTRWQWLSDAWSRAGFEIAKLRWGQTSFRKYLLWAVAPVLVVLLYQIIKRARRQQQRKNGSAADRDFQWPGLDSDFYQLELFLRERGIFRTPAEPLSVWLARATEDPGLSIIRQPLMELLRLHYRYRFDPRGLSPEDREELRRQTRACLQLASKPVPAGD